MKKTLYIIIFMMLLAGKSIAGDGTQTNPFSISEAVKIKNTAQKYYMRGYIVGEMNNFSNNKYFYELAPPFNGTTAYLIADNADELDLGKCMPVQLGNNYDLYDRPEYWRKQVLICGNIKSYFNMPGVKDLSYFEILHQEPLTNEAALWTFYEDFNSKNYIPSGSANTFAGGIYSGETVTWKFTGATWGDTGKDQKWGRAAARVRLTEGGTGSAGYIQMEEDKLNGIGTVRFWAGNYEEDSSGGALALYISRNSGNTWEKVSGTQPITKKWQEYQFVVNQQGNLRLRIAKDETGSKGINIDNIRISDYYSTTGLNKKDAEKNFNYYITSEGVNIRLNSQSNIKLYSITGQIIWSKDRISGEIFIPLQKGIYMLSINGHAFKITTR